MRVLRSLPLFAVALAAACASHAFQAQNAEPAPSPANPAPTRPQVSLGMGLGFANRGLPVVSVVTPNGPAAEAGLMVGDTIMSVDGRDPREIGVFTTMVPGGIYSFLIRRGEREFEVRLTADPLPSST